MRELLQDPAVRDDFNAQAVRAARFFKDWTSIPSSSQAMASSPRYYTPKPGGCFYSPESEAIGALTRLAADFTRQAEQLKTASREAEKSYQTCFRVVQSGELTHEGTLAICRMANNHYTQAHALRVQSFICAVQYTNCLAGIDRINARVEDQVRLSNEIIAELITEERAGK